MLSAEAEVTVDWRLLTGARVAEVSVPVRLWRTSVYTYSDIGRALSRVSLLWRRADQQL